MYKQLLKWNRRVKMGVIVAIMLGVVAAIPLAYARWQVEQTSNNVELVVDYRDLLQVASHQAHPQQFIQDQLLQLKSNHIQTLAVYEPTLEEMAWSHRLSLYRSSDIRLMAQQPLANENFTYILFSTQQDAEQLSPLITAAFTRKNIPVQQWSLHNQSGLVIETAIEHCIHQPLPFDATVWTMLDRQGFTILPRITLPPVIDMAAFDQQLDVMQRYHVKRTLFQLDSTVKMYAQSDMKKVAQRLNQYEIGIATVENSSEQQRFGSLAWDVHFNAVRVHSLSDIEMLTLSPQTIVNRIQLAVKDRNIRMIYINIYSGWDAYSFKQVDSLDNMYASLAGSQGVAARLLDGKFQLAPAQAFDPHPWQANRWLQMIVALGAISIISLLIDVFVRKRLVFVWLAMLVISVTIGFMAPEYVRQALALGVAVSTPTLATIFVMKRVARTKATLANVFMLFVGGILRALLAVPFIVGLLNDVSYMLVFQQFRGVSMLHVLPIVLVVGYGLFYMKKRSVHEVLQFLQRPIKMIWVCVALIVFVGGYYYLTRTGNNGSVSSLELTARTWLEQHLNVRPRTKEFLIAHPLFLVATYMGVIRRRQVLPLFIIGVVGQLSMVDTFAHLHTPLVISAIRVLLGVGFGTVIGFMLIAIIHFSKGMVRKWYTKHR